MDIFDDAALRRPISYALNLRLLPTELVHNVLDELPIVKVLQVLAHKHQDLTNCVLSHQKWRRLFNSQDNVDYVIDEFILYNEVCRFTGSKVSAGSWYFTRGCHAREFGTTVKVYDLREDIIRAVRCLLPSTTREVALLQAHSDKPYPGQQSDVTELWSWIKHAKCQQNKSKSKQLSLVADILANYPEMLMVKKPLDPDQGRPRKNLKHIETRFRLQAKKILQNHRLRFRGPVLCKEGVDNIELVPYDRYLWLFLDTLKTHPYDEERTRTIRDSHASLSAEFDALTMGENALDRSGTTSDYPPEIRAKLEKVLEGLAYVYTGSSQLMVERIE
jgi:hypothetical protein